MQIISLQTAGLLLRKPPTKAEEILCKWSCKLELILSHAPSHDWAPLMHASYKSDDVAVTLLLKPAPTWKSRQVMTRRLFCSRQRVGLPTLHECFSRLDVCRNQLGLELQASTLRKVSSKPRREQQGARRQSARSGMDTFDASVSGVCEDIARILHAVQVNVEVRSPHDKRALEIARANGRIGMAQILQNAGHAP